MGRTTVIATQTGTGLGTVHQRYAYTARGQLWRQWGSQLEPAQRHYDAAGRLVQLDTYRGGSGWDGATWPAHPGAADTTTWTYHPTAGLLTATTDAQGRSTHFTYNRRHQITQRTSPRTHLGQPITTSYTYHDQAPTRTGELHSIHYSDGTPPVTLHYQHHGGHSRLGRPTAVDDATGWRGLGWRLTDGQPEYEWFNHSYYGHNGSTGRDIWYEYETGDPAHGAVPGRPRGYDVGWGSQRDAILRLRLSHQATTGRIGTVELSGGFGAAAAFDYGYQVGGDRIGTVTRGNFQRYTYWQSWRELPDGVITFDGAHERARFHYDYDWLGQRTREHAYGQYPGYLGWSAHGHGFSHWWAHNSRGHTQHQHTHSHQLDPLLGPIAGQPHFEAHRSWTHDPLGNRTQEQRGNGAPETWTADHLNHVTGTGPSSGLGSPTYDEEGNLKEDAQHHYRYDAANRLIELEQKHSPFEKYRYSYDYLGRRVRKQRFAANWTPLADTRYLYVGWQLLAELDGQNLTAAPLRSYGWGLDALGTLGSAGGTGALLMVRESNGARYLPVYDARHNVRGHLDESGQLVGAVEYTPFGEVVRQVGSYTSNPIGFASLYRDAESGMNYHHHRYLHPALGRFISRDPIGIAGGLHLQAYVRHSPVNGWDMLGQNPQFAGFGPMPVPVDPHTARIGSINRGIDQYNRFVATPANIVIKSVNPVITFHGTRSTVGIIQSGSGIANMIAGGTIAGAGTGATFTIPVIGQVAGAKAVVIGSAQAAIGFTQFNVGMVNFSKGLAGEGFTAIPLLGQISPISSVKENTGYVALDEVVVSAQVDRVRSRASRTGSNENRHPNGTRSGGVVVTDPDEIAMLLSSLPSLQSIIQEEVIRIQSEILK